MTEDLVTLAPARPDDFTAFKRELQDAFAVAVVAESGPLDEPIPSDADLDESLGAPGSVVLRILSAGRKVGGAVVTIDHETGHNALDLFYINVGEEGQGLGIKAWQAIEQRYPETVVWRTHTPYFEKRNIHFYVNKCGFKIVVFYNRLRPDPHRPPSGEPPELDEAFAFEKIMRPENRSEG